MAGRMRGPLVAGIAGLALLVAAMVSAGDAATGVSDALRASGVLDRPAAVVPAEIPAPQNTVADLTFSDNPEPRRPVWEDWTVALFTSFDDDVAWDYGVSDAITRDFTGDSYTVARSADSNPVFVPTWQNGYRAEADFLLAVDVVSSSGSVACGLVVGAEDLPAMFFVVDSIDGDFSVTNFVTNESADTLADGARPTVIQAVGVNHLALHRQGETFTIFANDTPLTEFTSPAIDISDMGLATFAPAGTETAVCEFDNFEIRWP
jgi:hypothetical protein